ncbi:MAG: FAD-dependent oxidoreductase [Candidatus Hydrogenedentota bacterium]
MKELSCGELHRHTKHEKPDVCLSCFLLLFDIIRVTTFFRGGLTMESINKLFDMERGYSLSQAIAEADRCLLCYDAPCSAGCPADTDPGKFIRKLRLKNLKGAIRTIKENNILGGICGIVCPTKRLCEEKCSSTEIDRPINIGKLQRFLIEYGWQIGFNPIIKKQSNSIHIAVIGSGPAGLSCAATLAKQGYSVTIFEKEKKPGGILRYGVPSFRLNDEFVDREINDVLALGVKIKCNKAIKGNGAIEKLLKKGYKAVFVSTGLSIPYSLKIPGVNLKNVTTAQVFLRNARNGNVRKLKLMVRNKNVAIIGGGSVAMDVACTCKSLGAKRVYCIALESMKELPADKDDLQMAIDNYVIIKPQAQVKEIIGRGGEVCGVRGTETEWIKKGLLIPSNVREVPDTSFSLKVKAVIIAIGSAPDVKLKEQLPSVKFNKRDLIVVNKNTLETAKKGIYAGGDIVRGPARVIDAVADGKLAAKSIMKNIEARR